MLWLWHERLLVERLSPTSKDRQKSKVQNKEGQQERNGCHPSTVSFSKAKIAMHPIIPISRLTKMTIKISPRQSFSFWSILRITSSSSSQNTIFMLSANPTCSAYTQITLRTSSPSTSLIDILRSLLRLTSTYQSTPCPLKYQLHF